jgi:4,5-DOPA dioxygenase extradiol
MLGEDEGGGMSARMPVVFFGHGSPMIALQDNDTTRTWARMAASMPRPAAILAISAHWLTRGTAVTAMARPRTIHDFGAFPQALFDVQYPAPGDPALAARVAGLLAPRPVALDAGAWGLDHGTWSVLVKAYPAADIPVVQLSLDVGASPAEHFEIGRRLAPLRDEGVLIVGTGNIVHNLPRMDWSDAHAPPHAWATRFREAINDAIARDQPARVIDFAAQGADASLSVPSPDHFWPLLYVLGARGPADQPVFETDHIEHASLSMTTVLLAEAA